MSTDKDDEKNSTSKVVNTNAQHQTWVDFQKSISVSGFETGQVTVADANAGRKKRGGAQLRKKKEKERLKREEQVRMANVAGGHFPALRYSEEETVRLLMEAHAAIPKRAGKRGTLNRKRQRLRWWNKRKYDKIYKRQQINAHFARMKKRSTMRKDVLHIKATAPDILKKETEYQKSILRRWASDSGMSATLEEGVDGRETGHKDGVVS